MIKTAYLRCGEGGHRIRLLNEPEIPIKKFTIGRTLPLQGQADIIPVVGVRVSKIHCEILFTKGGHFLKDSKSRNGTFLNGKKVSHTQWTNLLKGDRFWLGYENAEDAKERGLLFTYSCIFYDEIPNLMLPYPVISAICDYLSPRDLTSAQLVDRNWCYSATPALLQSTTFPLSLSFHRVDTKRNSDLVTNYGKLIETAINLTITDIEGTTSHFPYEDINPPKTVEDNMWLLRTYFHKVKSITYRIDPLKLWQLRFMTSTLERFAPNLEALDLDLHFSYGSYNLPRTLNFSPQLTFPNLKLLKIGVNVAEGINIEDDVKNLILRVFQATPFVKTLELFLPAGSFRFRRLTTVALEIAKTTLPNLTEIVLPRYLFPTRSAATLLDLLLSIPQNLTVIDLPFLYESTNGNRIETFLRRFSGSLKELHLRIEEGGLNVQINFPMMPNLKKLEIAVRAQPPHLPTISTNVFSTTFPVLQSLTISGIWLDLQPTRIISTTVTHLKVERYSQFDHRFTRIYFPNLKKLEIV